MSKKTKAAPAAAPQNQQQIQELTIEQEIGALRAAHQFFGNFNGVPGILAAQWGQALDAIGVVANSLISKAGLLNPAPAPAAEKKAEATEEQPQA